MERQSLATVACEPLSSFDARTLKGSEVAVQIGLPDAEGLEQMEEKEASPGFEPGVTVLQTVALPLGDEAESNGADLENRIGGPDSVNRRIEPPAPFYRLTSPETSTASRVR